MRSKLFLLAVALCLALLSAAVTSAGTIPIKEADLFPYSDPLTSGAGGDVYVSDAGVGVWHVSPSGALTL